MNKSIFFIFVILFSCNSNIKKEAIYGYWSKELQKFDNEGDYDVNDTAMVLKVIQNPRPFGYLPFGFSINEKGYENFYGYYENSIDTITNNRTKKYYGNYAKYKLIKDSLFILKPIEKEWSFIWKVNKILKDTLFVTLKSGKKRKYIRLNEYEIRNDFDKIIFSSSHCYGTCPVMNILIDKKGKVIFKGEKYVNQIGIFDKVLDKENKEYIFNKFNRVDINNLRNNYNANHTDDKTNTITFIKNGKIVKTISDYGTVAPRELVWCYDRISNIHNILKFDTIKQTKINPKLEHFKFLKDSLVLYLEKSESFYLWLELNNGKISNKTFENTYQLDFHNEDDYFWNENTNKFTKRKGEIKKILTDGRFYKILFSNSKSKTLDIGYNFIERNFTENEFKINSW